MNVECIECGKRWEKPSYPRFAQDVSSSLCPRCFRRRASHLIRRRQLREGNFDCFGKAVDYCDQLECKYRKWCLRDDE